MRALRQLLDEARAKRGSDGARLDASPPEPGLLNASPHARVGRASECRKNDAILQDNTSRCRAFGCWDTYEAEWCDGAVVPGIVPARLSGSTTKAQALFKHLRAHVPGRGYSRDPLTGGHLIYLIAPPGSARLTRGHTGYRPSRPECYIGECEVGQWRRPRLRRHLTRAVTEAGEPEFLTELLRQGYQPFAEVIEYGHENRTTARRADEDFCDIAERFG
jgi:hypothetical protein